MGEPFRIEELLDERKDDLASIGNQLLAGKREDALSGLAGLVTTLASGIPVLGKLVSAGAARALVAPASEILEKQIAAWKAEQDQQALADMVAAAVQAVLTVTIQTLLAQRGDASAGQVEDLVSDAVIQLRRGQQEICAKLDRLWGSVQTRQEETARRGAVRLARWVQRLDLSHHGLTVLQPAEGAAPADGPNTCFSYDFMAIHAWSAAWAVSSIEPSEEDSFHAAISRFFWEDQGTTVSRDQCNSSRVVVEHRDPALTFHRAWGRWDDGTLAMFATLRNSGFPGHYSLADLAIDAVRFLHLCATLAVRGEAFVSLGYDPYFLSLMTTPCDGRIQNAATFAIGGIDQIGRPALTERSQFKRSSDTVSLGALRDDAHLIVARLLVPLVRDFHHARVDTARFSASIPPILEGLRKLQAR